MSLLVFPGLWQRNLEKFPSYVVCEERLCDSVSVVIGEALSVRTHSQYIAVKNSVVLHKGNTSHKISILYTLATD